MKPSLPLSLPTDLGVLPDVAGGLPPLGQEEHTVPLERCVGRGGEVQVALTDLNIQSERLSPHIHWDNTSGYLSKNSSRVSGISVTILSSILVRSLFPFRRMSRKNFGKFVT